MVKSKCPRCGLVNPATDANCRRCGAYLERDQIGEDDSVEEQPRNRGLLRRFTWIISATSILLFAFYMSLLLTSHDLGLHERETVQSAVSVLEQKGFDKEAFVIRRLATYRDSDNWWNNYMGHRDAYAATNFPFEVLTLYPEFFQAPVDDDERAAILLHEAYHLLGSGEEAALEGVWRNKQRLGWTAEKYGQSKVWRGTRELTIAYAPQLFRCGDDGKSDCTP
jgi:hypothetical protein